MTKPKLEDAITERGKLAKIWFGVTEEMKTPRCVRLHEQVSTAQFGGGISLGVHTDAWDTGLMFVAPGTDTMCFSIEETDDGTADEFYGPTQEFYYILAGEITIHYGTDTAKIKRKEAESYVVRAGDYCVHAVGWKYMVSCTSSTPATFLWCKHIPSGPPITERVQVPYEIK
jgi:hypothetical protein